MTIVTIHIGLKSHFFDIFMVASWRFGWSEEDMKSAYFSSEESAKTAQRKKNIVI